MFLRSLTLKGFKSFAEKTTLEFAPGVSVIVGPNGSGKSNLVDAISWVLGEQGPRALRGGQMSDVIFAGSPKRPALGMAEVKLVIDNEAGMIPVPMSEIEISRTVFRSGDAEYRMGGQQVRLMDIQELLSDSGIGRALHTVVGQGQLDDVLTARPEERRQYIEEAAGIAKHRRRKERAQRKLASLEQDLLRLQDVLTELRRQLKPLRQQAEVAQRHEKLSAEAEDISWRLAAARLRSLNEASAAKRPAWEQGVLRRDAGKRRIEELDAEIERLTTERERSARELLDAEATLAQAATALERAKTGAAEALESETSARDRLGTEATRASRARELRAELGRSEEALHASAGELDTRERELELAEAEFRRADDARRVAEEERRRLSEGSAAHRAEMETLRRSLTSYERERARVEESLRSAESRVDAAGSQMRELEAEVLAVATELEPLMAERVTLEGERSMRASEVAEIEDRLRRAMSRRDVLEARRADVDETPGSRFIASNPGRAIGLLGDLVECDRKFADALTAALGPNADAVVYEHAETALADAGEARGATLAAGDASSVDAGGAPGHALLDEARCDARARGLLEALLVDVYIVDDLSEAATKHRSFPTARFVTLDGVVFGRGLIHTAGTDVRAGEIMAQLATAEREVASAQQDLQPARATLRAVDEKLKALNDSIGALDSQGAVAAGRRGGLDAQVASATKEVELLSQRLSGMDEAAETWRDALAAAPAAPVELPNLPARAEPPIIARVAVESLRRERMSIEATIERLRAELDQLAAESPEALRAGLEAVEGARIAADEALAGAELTHTEAVSRREAAMRAERDMTAAESETNRQWREAAAELDQLREHYEEEDRARGDLERRIADAERTLREGFGREPAEALGELKDGDTAAELERRSELVARRLTLLGRVNPLATGEFEVLEQRADFMTRELDDVKKARRDLMEVMRRVDDEVISLFDSAFRDIAAEFEAMFKELFPGGEGRLILTDPADLLETGVDVEARPGRKRVKRLSLLSGGERALTAIGFLFSIFKARPSPFYLLDEVEAALDDVNLHRFLGLIKGFAQDSQVIVVSHQKRTMEIADMLYGVSMSPDVSSRVVCQKLDHGEALHVTPLLVSRP